MTRTGFAAVNETRPEVPLQPGSYYWRVVTLAGGYLYLYACAHHQSLRNPGRYPYHRSELCSEPGKVYWRHVPGAAAYELQIAEDEFFSRITSTLTLLEPSARWTCHPISPGMSGFVPWVTN